MSRKYKIFDSKRPYFISIAVVNWIDLFTRKKYVDALTDSLHHISFIYPLQISKLKSYE